MYNPQAYNRYAYTLNNPLSFTDKTGFKPDPNAGVSKAEFSHLSSEGGGPDTPDRLGSGNANGPDAAVDPDAPQDGFGGTLVAQASRAAVVPGLLGKPAGPPPGKLDAMGRPLGVPVPSGAPPLAIDDVKVWTNPIVEALVKGAVSLITNSTKADPVPGANSPVITPDDLRDRSRDELEQQAKDKGLVQDPKKPNKWRDPVTGDERMRIDPGHVDPKTGQPYDNPRAAVPHVHGYDPAGNKIRDPRAGNDPHFPIRP